jgi:2-phospho-L-lactate/phosphoenolpyruvate guanylyltransferase
VRTAAILPVKSFGRAKQRLGAGVPDPLRLALARAMVGDVLAALATIDGVELTLVVTREPEARQAATAAGARVIDDPGEAGQSAAAGLGVEWAVAEGFERVLLVPGDCPALDPAELGPLLAEHGRSGPEVAILPDRHGTGTNGLLLAPPQAIEPSFGAGSCERHRELARSAGVTCRVASLRSLSLDVDTVEDLAALRTALASLPAGAPNTRAVLEAQDPAGAVALASRA